MIRYRILGRIDVFDGVQWRAPGAAKQRALLACLLVHANRFVSADALVYELWGDRPPESATKSLQVYIHRLRQGLGGGQSPLRTRHSGYELCVEPGELDAERFASLAGLGRAALAKGRPGEAVVTLTEGLALWRGEAFADVPPGRSVATEISRLEEARLTAWQDLADARLATGSYRELAAELDRLVTEHPLREALWARLVHALHLSGERSEALRAYAAARTVLRDELGVEPGAGLRDVHRLVLATPEQPRRSIMCELPPDIAHFVGRDRELNRVLGGLGDEPERPADLPGRVARTPRVVVITGLAGVGKSSFAVHAAHALRDAFADGQLYADLRAGSSGRARPGDVLATVLQTLGVPRASLPSRLDALASRYRSELADRRILVVLDNAADAQQVRPLLPGTGSGAVLITSRGRLAGVEGALRIPLNLFDDNEARTLLAHATGDDRVQRAPRAAARLTRQCGNLPLAVRIAGVRLAGRPHLTPLRLADTLADEGRRLDELVAGDLDLRSALGIGYRALSPRARRAFRLLGVLNADSVPSWVVRVLLGASGGEADSVTDALIEQGLLEIHTVEGTPGAPRFRMHELARLFARELSASNETPHEKAEAVDRVCAAYLRASQRAARGIVSEAAGLPAGPGPSWAGPRPLSWLEAEYRTVSRLVGQADPGTAWRLAAGLAGYFESAARNHEWRTTHETALAAVRRAGDLRGEAAMQRGLGEVNTVQDRYTEAIACFRLSLRAYRLHGRRDPGEAEAGAGLGVLLRLRGRHGEAIACLEQAIESARVTRNAWAQSYAGCALGTVYLERGMSGEARVEFERSLAIAAATGYRAGEYSALRCLGLVELAGGRLGVAQERLEEAQRIAAETGNVVGEVHVGQWLGHLIDLGGDSELAERTLVECLTAYRGFGDRFGEALTLRTLADLRLHNDRPEDARLAAQESLAIWQRLGSPYWTARTLDVLAEMPGAEADGERARRGAATLRAAMGLSSSLRPAAAGTRRSVGGHLLLDVI
ncbi:BTAD domain-containing putative transcriptional regulator [Streptomyces sp. NPDC055749]